MTQINSDSSTQTPRETKIRILDSPEQRWIFRRLRIAKRLEEHPIPVELIQECVEDILRLWRPSSPDSEDQPGRPTANLRGESELPQRASTPTRRSPHVVRDPVSHKWRTGYKSAVSDLCHHLNGQKNELQKCCLWSLPSPEEAEKVKWNKQKNMRIF